MARLKPVISAAVVLVVLLLLATPVHGADGGRGEWSPQSLNVQLSKDGAPFWNGTVTYTPSFSTSNGSVYVTFSGKLASGAPGKDCLDAAGSDSCAARWRYPEQHASDARLTFDTGMSQSQGGNYFAIPAGATRITHLDFTVADAVHDVGNGPNTPASVSFGEAFNLADGSRVDGTPRTAASEPGASRGQATATDRPAAPAGAGTASPAGQPPLAPSIAVAAALAAVAAALVALRKARKRADNARGTERWLVHRKDEAEARTDAAWAEWRKAKAAQEEHPDDARAELVERLRLEAFAASDSADEARSTSAKGRTAADIAEAGVVDAQGALYYAERDLDEADRAAAKNAGVDWVPRDFSSLEGEPPPAGPAGNESK